MKQSVILANEAERLAALRRYEILDTPAELRFDALTRLAAQVLKVPIALVSLVDADRQWFKSRYGLDAPEAPRDVSFCGHVVAADAPLVVPDAKADERFFDNPFVTGEPRVRFYAGAPLRTPDGFVLGTLCAIDHEPRELTETEQETLALLAGQVVELLELQRMQTQRTREVTDFLENSTVPMHWISADGVILWANRAELELLGYEKEEYCGRPITEFHTDPPVIADILTRLTQGDVLHDYQAHLRAKDGTIKTVLIDSSVYRDAGKFVHTRCVSRDISERAARMAELETHHQFFAMALDLLCTINGSFYFELLNPSWAKTLGWTQEELRARSVLELVHPEDLERTQAEANRLLVDSAQTVNFENRYRHKDGTWVVLSWVAAARNGILYCAARDISAYVATTNAQADSETRLRAIIDTAVDAILTIDDQGQIERVNPSAERIFGYSPAELIGHNVNVLMPSPDWEQHDGYLAKYGATGERKVIGIGREITGRRKDGSVFAAELAVSEMFVDGKKLFTGIIRDISQRKGVERELSEWKRVDRLKSEFVSIVSHELRTPLTSIRGSLGLVANGITGPLPKQALEYVGIALSNSERLVRLINDILDIEKIQSGSMNLRVQPVDLAVVVKKAVAANEAFAGSHQVTLTVVEEVPLMEVLVDEDRLMQVLTNLISNAVKFSQAGQPVELSMVQRDTRVRVNVRDHGPGISEEFSKRIFQRFAQEDSSDTRKKGGTGLGLSISKALIEEMKGEIGFQTVPGQGTTFFIDLPFIPAVHAIASRSNEDSEKRVLVCENDLDVAHLMTRVFEQAGSTVHVAPTLERARALLAAFRYRIVTLELMLADGPSGILISEIRKNSANAGVPIIVISGANAAQLDAQIGPAAGVVDDILPKPIDEERLAKMIHSMRAYKNIRTRVLHVEDDADLRRIVKRLLPQDWELSGADTIAHARELLGANLFDIVLLDLSLPDGSGESLLDRVGDAQVVIFSAIDATPALARRVTRALVKSRTTEFQLRDAVVALVNEPKASEPSA